MTAQVEKKRSSRWNVFKKRRKKKQEQQNEVENEKQCIPPPRSDATTATSEANSLLGRIATKKRSKNNLNVEEGIYAPPAMDFNPPFDVAPRTNDAPPTADGANAVLAPATTSPPPTRKPMVADTVSDFAPIATPSPPPHKAKADGSSRPEERKAPVPTEKPFASSKSEGSPTSVISSFRDTAASPTPFFSNLDGYTTSPTAFMSEIDPFGFPSLSPEKSKPNEDDAWNSFAANRFHNVAAPKDAAIKPSQTSSATTKQERPKDNSTSMRKVEQDNDIQPTASSVRTITKKSYTKKARTKEMSSKNTGPAVSSKGSDPSLETRRAQSTKQEATKVATEADTPVGNDDSILTESSMDMSQYSDVQNLPKRTLFLRRRARERIMEEAEQQKVKKLEKDEPVKEPQQKKEKDSERDEKTMVPEQKAVKDSGDKDETVKEPKQKKVKDEKATESTVSDGITRHGKIQKRMETRDSLKLLKSLEPKNEDSTVMPKSGDLKQDVAGKADGRVQPRANLSRIQLMRQLREKRELLKSKSSESREETKQDTSTEVSDAATETSAGAVNPMMDIVMRSSVHREVNVSEEPKLPSKSSNDVNLSPDTGRALDATEKPDLKSKDLESSEDLDKSDYSTMTSAGAEDPIMALVMRPREAPTLKLKEKAHVTTVALESSVHREVNVSQEPKLPSKSSTDVNLSPDTGRALDATEKPNLKSKDLQSSEDLDKSKELESISEEPGPSDLVRKSFSFEIDNDGSKLGMGRSNSFDHPRSKVVGSRIEELPASSRGTDLYLKRYLRRQHIDDRYESIEQDDDHSSSLAHNQRLQETMLPRHVEKTARKLIQVVTVDDVQDGEIEIVLPGEAKDALCKFEAYYKSDVSEVNETTASCTVTSDDLRGDGSWADTQSDGDTNTLDSDDESRSYATDEESGSLVTNESRSLVTESYTVDGSKITIRSDDSKSLLTDSYISTRTGESFISIGSTTYISDDESSTYDSEAETVDDYLWEDITAKIFMVKPWKGGF